MNWSWSPHLEYPCQMVRIWSLGPRRVASSGTIIRLHHLYCSYVHPYSGCAGKVSSFTRLTITTWTWGLKMSPITKPQLGDNTDDTSTGKGQIGLSPPLQQLLTRLKQWWPIQIKMKSAKNNQSSQENYSNYGFIYEWWASSSTHIRLWEMS